MERTNNPEIKSQVRIFLVGYGLLMIWGLTLPLNYYGQIVPFRQSLFSLTWVIWAYGVWKTPFVLNYNNSKPKLLIIANKEGIPLFSYDFNARGELEDDILISGALTSLNLLLDHTLASETKHYTTRREDEVILSTASDKVATFLVCSGMLKIINSALNVFSSDFERIHESTLNSKIVNKKSFEGTEKLIEEIFDPLFDF